MDDEQVEPPQKTAEPAPDAKPTEIPPVASTQEATAPPANVYAGIVAEREQAIADLAGPTDAGNDVIHLDEPLDFTGATDTRRLTLDNANG